MTPNLSTDADSSTATKKLLSKLFFTPPRLCPRYPFIGHPPPPPQKCAKLVLHTFGRGYQGSQDRITTLWPLWPRGRHSESCWRQVVSDNKQGGSWSQDGVGMVTGRDEVYCCPSTCPTVNFMQGCQK